VTESETTFSRKVTVSILLLFLVACSFLAYSSLLQDLLSQDLQIKSLLAATGAAAPIVFVLATAMLTAVGMPRLIFCSVAGAIFGFSWGFVWSQLGTLLGAYSIFLFARWSGRAYIQQWFPKIESWSKPIGQKGWLSVLLIRQLPVGGLYNDILLGLSTVRSIDFWIGSAIGFLPLGVTATLVGAGVVNADLSQIAHYFAQLVEL
jgi:uncharacterized membrane protein YdjX (TVP38/TMEM64 family)